MNSTISYDNIIKAADEIEKHAPKQYDNPFAFKPMSFAGLPVYGVKDRVYPKLQLSESFADKWLTDEAKDKINAKLVNLLGVNVVKLVPEGIVYMMGNNIMMRPEQVAMFTHCIA